MNGEKREIRKRKVNWDVVYRLKYGGGGLDFTFNALQKNLQKKELAVPDFHLHSDIVAPIY
jgi:hypothetical protein